MCRSGSDVRLCSKSSRGVIVLKDLSCPVDDAAADTIITLSDELGECVMKRSESIVLRDGESIRMSTNRGILLVIGEAHVHPQPQEGRNLQAAAGESSGFFSSWLNWAYVPVPHNSFMSETEVWCLKLGYILTPSATENFLSASP